MIDDLIIAARKAETRITELEDEVSWATDRCNKAMDYGKLDGEEHFKGTINSSVAAVCDALIDYRVHLEDLRYRHEGLMDHYKDKAVHFDRVAFYEHSQDYCGARRKCDLDVVDGAVCNLLIGHEGYHIDHRGTGTRMGIGKSVYAIWSVDAKPAPQAEKPRNAIEVEREMEIQEARLLDLEDELVIVEQAEEEYDAINVVYD